MRAVKVWSGLGPVLAALAVLGCASAPVPEDRYFRLVAPTHAKRSAPLLEGTLVVKRLAADGLLAHRALAYADADSPQVLFQYHYHFWSDPPTVLLQQLCVDRLRGAGLADRVMTPEYGEAPQFVLSGRIRRLEHLVGAAPTVAVSLELALTRTSDRRLLLLRSYERKLPVEGEGIDAAVASINRAANELLDQFIADVAAL